MAQKIQLRRDTSAAWTAANPVLAEGELGVDTTVDKIKLGDGVSAWNALPYITDFTRSGAALAYAENLVQVATGTTEIDIPGLSITFTTPTDRDVWVIGKAANVNNSTAGGVTTVKLADAGGVTKDQASMRPSTAGYVFPNIFVEEIIPAGSGLITRVMRLVSTTANATINNANSGKSTLQAITR